MSHQACPRTSGNWVWRMLNVQFGVALRPQRLYGLLGTGVQDGNLHFQVQNSHLHFHTAPELCCFHLFQCCLTSTETVRIIRDGESRTVSSAFTQLLSFVLENVPLVEFTYLVFTRMPGESYRRRLRSLLLCLRDVFRALINSPVC